MGRFPGVRLLLAAVLLGVAAAPCAAQGGWRQWNVLLRDGSRVEANPLGAPDDEHISLSVGAFQGREPSVPRSRVDYVAAMPGDTLLSPPTDSVREDLIVWRDGRRTSGHVTLTRVTYSAGIITQRGVDVDLADVAYIKFARALDGRGENESRLPACHGCNERRASSEWRGCHDAPGPSDRSGEVVMSSSSFRAAQRRVVQMLTAAGTLAVVTPVAVVHAQSCRLDYQRAESESGTLGSSAAALGVEQLSLGTNQQQGFVTDWKYETMRGTAAVRYGSHLRAAVNRGTEPIALALVGQAVNGFASAVGSDVARAMGGGSGGVVAMGGLSGGVVNDRGRSTSWILLQAGERADNLRHDLAGVACGGSNLTVRAVTDVLLRAPSGSGSR